jgi:hypothetical protein
MRFALHGASLELSGNHTTHRLRRDAHLGVGIPTSSARPDPPKSPQQQAQRACTLQQDTLSRAYQGEQRLVLKHEGRPAASKGCTGGSCRTSATPTHYSSNANPISNARAATPRAAVALAGVTACPGAPWTTSPTKRAKPTRQARGSVAPKVCATPTGGCAAVRFGSDNSHTVCAPVLAYKGPWAGTFTHSTTVAAPKA